ANHLGAAHAAKRTQRRHEVNRFEDVGLALRVVTEQQVKARRKISVQPRVIAEVAESQMSQMHARKNEVLRTRRRAFFHDEPRNPPARLKPHAKDAKAAKSKRSRHPLTFPSPLFADL